jgi:hypothetical protein
VNDDDTRALLEALERAREVRGSLPLFDALVRDDAAAFSAALAEHPRHPIAAEGRAWLAARGLPAPAHPSAEERLVALGITDVDAFVEQARRTERELRRKSAELAEELHAARRLSNATAAVCVVLGLLAAAGWAAVLGDLPFPRAASPPTIDELRKDATEERRR